MLKRLLDATIDSQNFARWGQLHGAALSLAVANAVEIADHLSVIIASSSQEAQQIENELAFFLQEKTIPLLHFPEWETLPYDVFSPHQDIISERLATLALLPHVKHGILITTIQALMNRLPPTSYIQATSFDLSMGNQIDLNTLRQDLLQNGYHCCEQVYEHGEFAVRGAVLDIFPMGSELPYRIELFDTDIETIRTFDVETQRSIEKIEKIELLPAKEFPLTKEAISEFRLKWRDHFSGNPAECSMYQDVSQGLTSPGIEYFISLFFKETATLADYFPKNTTLFLFHDAHEKASAHWQEIQKRYDQLSHDIYRPILPPQKSFLPIPDLFAALNQFQQIELFNLSFKKEKNHDILFSTSILPNVNIQHKSAEPLLHLKNYLASSPNRTLICAETAGRREALVSLLKNIHLTAHFVESWPDFLTVSSPVCLTVYPLERGLVLDEEKITLLSESQLFGERIFQRRLRKKETREADNLIRNLAELKLGDAVVHLEHGVGRYLGLQIITVDDLPAEYLTLEYANQTKLYVPVSSLHLISRYSGTDLEHAPLHKLGTEQWEKAKRRAAEKINDVAAELLDIYARRAAQKGLAFSIDENYQTFAESFPFEETPDQQTAIDRVIEDMSAEKTMDRLVCGDVGFGKTEVAMRAAFIAAHEGKQVAILCPTTLLAQQHYQNFKDRFADWPINIDVLSRFRSAKDQKIILEKIKEHKIDILIATHKLLSDDIVFANLGLLIIDEEHRFGVKQKEKLKSLRTNIDILTLTATPIPRTLNMAFAGMRDLSIISTPPARRLAIKTFVQKRNDNIIREAILREILRGGQVYFLHNNVDTIASIAEEIHELIPEARVGIGHGQMRERELEQVMADFYHRRFNVLVATTIIETGIDIPSANTIIIDRADMFGLAQLHQLRGRVGRSHHQAYAYLLTPDPKAITKDAEKRLEAISSLEDLGAGFTLATHDLEIRGAGELLGEEQSGQMQEIGFSLYMEMLEKCVKAIQAGKQFNFDEPLNTGAEIELKIPALIPEDYVPDVHTRLILYKRIANAKNEEELGELEIELVDRFSFLPPSLKNLFSLTQLKLKAEEIGIKKISMTQTSGYLIFIDKPHIDPMKIIQLVQKNWKTFQFEGSTKIKFKVDPPIKDVQEKLDWITSLLIDIFS